MLKIVKMTLSSFALPQSENCITLVVNILRSVMKFLPATLLIFILIGCEKYEIETVSDNAPPAETVVTAEMKGNYANRLFITLAGRKAEPAEFDSALQILGDSATPAQREQLIQTLFDLPEYDFKLYQIARGDYLESVDTALISEDFERAVRELQTATGGSYEYWKYVAESLFLLMEIPQKLDSALIDNIEIHRRIINNIYYDEINMGTENFVVATFQNFLFRYPTNAELENASAMVDGNPSSLFLEAGASRLDFTDIFFSSDDYFEGVVVNLYRKYLFRDPETAEMLENTQTYMADRDYQKLQIKILSSDEYFFN